MHRTRDPQASSKGKSPQSIPQKSFSLDEVFMIPPEKRSDDGAMLEFVASLGGTSRDQSRDRCC